MNSGTFKQNPLKASKKDKKKSKSRRRRSDRKKEERRLKKEFKRLEEAKSSKGFIGSSRLLEVNNRYTDGENNQDSLSPDFSLKHV